MRKRCCDYVGTGASVERERFAPMHRRYHWEYALLSLTGGLDGTIRVGDIGNTCTGGLIRRWGVTTLSDPARLV